MVPETKDEKIEQQQEQESKKPEKYKIPKGNKFCEMPRRTLEQQLIDGKTPAPLKRRKIAVHMGLSPDTKWARIKEECLANPEKVRAWDAKKKSKDYKLINKAIIEEEFSHLVLMGLKSLKTLYLDDELNHSEFVNSLNKLSSLYKNLEIGKQAKARATERVDSNPKNVTLNTATIEFGSDLDIVNNPNDDFDEGEI